MHFRNGRRISSGSELSRQCRSVYRCQASSTFACPAPGGLDPEPAAAHAPRSGAGVHDDDEMRAVPAGLAGRAGRRRVESHAGEHAAPLARGVSQLVRGRAPSRKELALNTLEVAVRVVEVWIVMARTNGELKVGSHQAPSIKGHQPYPIHATE